MKRKSSRKGLKKFDRNFKIAKRAIKNCASQNHMNMEDYTRLCKNSWMTLILYHPNTFPSSLLYAYEFYLKKYNCYGY